MQNDTPRDPVRSEAKRSSLAPVIAIIAVVVAAAAPRSTPFMLLLLGGTIVALGAATARTVAWRPLPHLVLAFAVLCGYLALNSMWSVVPLTGLSRALLLALIVAMGLAVARVLPILADEDADRLQLAIVYAASIAALFLTIETAFDQPIRRFVVSCIPILQPAPKHMDVADGWVTNINLYTLNRNLAFLNLILWPTLLLLKSRMPQGKAWLAGAVLLILSAIATFHSDHETSMIALPVACLVFVGILLARAVTRSLVIAGWLAATLLVVPAANFAHERGLHRVDWLPESARNRIVLWNVTADRMVESPVFGIGIESTKPLDQRAAPNAPREPGDTYAQRTGRHAHNVFMQTWFELGAIGAMLLLVVGLTALRAMMRLPAMDQSFAFASFASTMVLASFSWGVWQPWFMCAFGLWSVILLIAFDASRRARAE